MPITYVAMDGENNERKRAEEALRESEERFRTLFDRSVDTQLVHDEEGRILDCNAEACRTLGYAREELLSLRVKDIAGGLLSEEERREREKAGGTLWQRMVRGEPDTFGVVHYGEHRRKDGTTFPIEVHVGGVDYGGRRAILASVRDMTERKEAERRLEDGEQRYKSLFEHNPDAVYSFDLEGSFLSANPACERLTGYTTEELCRMSFVPLIVPQDLPRTMRHFEGASGGEPQNYEIAIIRRDGRRVELDVTNLPVVVGGEVVGVYGIAKDVTERKRAEEARSRLATIVEFSDDAIVSRALDGTIVSWNRGAERLYGYAAEEVVGRSSSFLYPPGHPREMPEILEKIRRGETIDHYETVRVAKDGRRVDVSLTVSPTLDAAGNVVGDSGIARDITERKRAEEEIRAAHVRHQEMIDSAEAIIWRADAYTFRFTFVSDQAEAILGYPAERWTEEPSFWLEHMHPDDREWALAFCRAATAERRSHTFEYRMISADGRVVWLRDGVRVVVKDGVPTELVGVMTDVTERKLLEEELRYRALHDGLTGLPNRALLVDRIEAALRGAERSAGCVAVLFLDLDDFKVVNDSLGHGAGDGLLVAAADRLRGCLRPSDTAARLGGDEFAVLLEGSKDEAEAARVADGIADRIGEALRKPYPLATQEAHVDVSVGVALGRPGSSRAEDLLRHADIAMYRAKAGGKARRELFDPGTDVKAARRLEAENRLRKAIGCGEIVAHYQPKVSLGEGEVVGMETLARWADPLRGLVSPKEFIPLAEETGLIVPMGEHVLREACRQALRWREKCLGLPPVAVWVNLSPKQFHRADVVEQVSSVLRETGLDPRCLGLEITEGVAMDDAESTIETLGRLRGLGVRLAIDDFGTGYSSLSYLKRFPVDVLKIDRSFVSGICERPEDLAIAQSVITLGRSLGMEVVAEGVETEEQLDRLRTLGCDGGQGYHFARPMPAEEAAAFLATRRDSR